MDGPSRDNNAAIWKNTPQYFWKWKEIDDGSALTDCNEHNDVHTLPEEPLTSSDGPLFSVVPLE